VADKPQEVLVGLAQVLDGAQPFKMGNVSDTYRGLIRRFDGEDCPAILKDLPVKELANEVLAAAVGIVLGLPIPRPYLALATPDRLKTSKGPLINDARLLFASTDVKQPQVAMLLEGSLAPVVLQRLAMWPGTGKLYGFDALVANVDRHAGNLLFSGDHRVWLIDHGRCFTGAAWQTADLAQPSIPTRNRLKEWLTPVLNMAARSLAAGGASTIPVDLAGVDLKEVAAANHVSDLLSDGDFQAVVEFLIGRQTYAPGLAAAALDMLEL
jgi:hypothetical protein